MKLKKKKKTSGGDHQWVSLSRPNSSWLPHTLGNQGFLKLNLNKNLFHIQKSHPAFLPTEPQGKPKNTRVGSLSFSSRSSQARNRTGVSCNAGGFFTHWAMREVFLGFPCGSAGKESTCIAGDLGFSPWVGKIPRRRERLPSLVFWHGEFHGLCSPWDRKVGYNWATFHFHLPARKGEIQEFTLNLGVQSSLVRTFYGMTHVFPYVFIWVYCWDILGN